MSFILVEEKELVFRIQMNRPEVRNSFHPQMIDELKRAFESASRSNCRAVLLLGSGKSFCAGADLNWMKSMKEYSQEENQKDSEALFSMFEAARNCTLPILGKIHGHVMGGATGLVAICDVAAAVESTKFCFSEVKIGLAPAVISPFVLRKMQIATARELMLTGEVFTASKAHASGLIQYVGNISEVDNYLQNAMKHIFQSGPEAIQETKKLLNDVVIPLFNGLKEKTAEVIAGRRVSLEGQQGLEAFFNQSNPEWKKEFDGTIS